MKVSRWHWLLVDGTKLPLSFAINEFQFQGMEGNQSRPLQTNKQTEGLSHTYSTNGQERFKLRGATARELPARNKKSMMNTYL